MQGGALTSTLFFTHIAACGWWRGSVVRASVFDWRTFPDMRLIYG